MSSKAACAIFRVGANGWVDVAEKNALRANLSYCGPALKVIDPLKPVADQEIVP
jgi:hypothetical protein